MVFYEKNDCIFTKLFTVFYKEITVLFTSLFADGRKKHSLPEFLAAEERLFSEQCKDVDILITTAVTPGKLDRLYSGEKVFQL